jgi:hypothetical protein
MLRFQANVSGHRHLEQVDSTAKQKNADYSQRPGFHNPAAQQQFVTSIKRQKPENYQRPAGNFA